MNEVLIELNNVGRIFKSNISEISAIDDVTCQIRRNDRIAIVGASGSGKSTLLHIICGVDAPTSGMISWGGFDGSVPLRPNQIGMVYQMQSLLPSLSVVENVELPLLLMDKPPKEARGSAEITLKKLGLLDLLNKMPDELSGGQLQRVAMARVLCTQPRLILADEPTGQLDHPTANMLLEELDKSLEGLDTAIVITTHDMGVAQKMDTIWHMEHGRLEVRQA